MENEKLLDKLESVLIDGLGKSLDTKVTSHYNVGRILASVSNALAQGVSREDIINICNRYAKEYISEKPKEI